MCGIAGCIDLSAQTSSDELINIAEAMAGKLAHRGPDDCGVWVDAATGVALGHRRLSIIDLSPAGHQPMRSSKQGHVLSCNGELYNYRELKRELEGSGIAFRGHADSEVLLEACAAWGVNGALKKALGMYALALWEPSSRCLYLARDHAGMKPLYWGKFDNWIVFGSELRALRAHPAFKSTIDRQAIAGLMAYNYVPAPMSIYQGVNKVRPGHILTIASNGDVTEKVLWSLHDTVFDGIDNPERDPDRGIDNLERCLRASVARHMVADVPVASLLSGGVDSSLVTALMQRDSMAPIRTYAVRFDDPAYDEADHAKAVASYLGTTHTEILVDHKSAASTIHRLADIYDEPFADLSHIPTSIVCARVAESEKVVLTGDGGDEMFAGYPRYRITWEHVRYLTRLPLSLRNGAAKLLRYAAHGQLGKLICCLPEFSGHQLTPERLRKLAALMQSEDFIEAYRRTLVHWGDVSGVVIGAHEPIGPLHPDWRGERAPHPLTEMRRIDTSTYLPDDILVKVDRAGMAVGLEARMPLLDKEVMEFAYRQDPSLHYREGSDKWLLRQVLYRHVPRKLVDRPKMGFGVPMHTWLRGSLRDWAEDLLDPVRMSAEGYLNPEPIQERWKQHLSGDVNWQYSLWPVLMFQQWLRHSQHGIG